jgi:hypothetical protein
MFSKEESRIENSRLYSSEVVDRLYAALSSGAELRADESRMNFYHVNSGARTYFISISPANGKVTLIASWAQEGCVRFRRESHLIAPFKIFAK